MVHTCTSPQNLSVMKVVSGHIKGKLGVSTHTTPSTPQVPMFASDKKHIKKREQRAAVWGNNFIYENSIDRY